MTVKEAISLLTKEVEKGNGEMKIGYVRYPVSSYGKVKFFEYESIQLSNDPNFGSFIDFRIDKEEV